MQDKPFNELVTSAAYLLRALVALLRKASAPFTHRPRGDSATWLGQFGSSSFRALASLTTPFFQDSAFCPSFETAVASKASLSLLHLPVTQARSTTHGTSNTPAVIDPSSPGCPRQCGRPVQGS